MKSAWTKLYADRRIYEVQWENFCSNNPTTFSKERCLVFDVALETVNNMLAEITGHQLNMRPTVISTSLFFSKHGKYPIHHLPFTCPKAKFVKSVVDGPIATDLRKATIKELVFLPYYFLLSYHSKFSGKRHIAYGVIMKAVDGFKMLTAADDNNYDDGLRQLDLSVTRYMIEHTVNISSAMVYVLGYTMAVSSSDEDPSSAVRNKLEADLPHCILNEFIVMQPPDAEVAAANATARLHNSSCKYTDTSREDDEGDDESDYCDDQRGQQERRTTVSTSAPATAVSTSTLVTTVSTSEPAIVGLTIAPVTTVMTSTTVTTVLTSAPAPSTCGKCTGSS